MCIRDRIHALHLVPLGGGAGVAGDGQHLPPALGVQAQQQSLGETLLPLSVMPNAGYPVVTRARVPVSYTHLYVYKRQDQDNSVLAAIATKVAWIFAPLGFGNWKATVASVSGLIAKENVVGTFGVLYHFGGEELSENGDEIWNLVAADYTCLLYTSRCV